MKVLSLFDGISCARIALERLGIKVDKYYASEVDKYAMQVSVKNYPDIIHLGDIKTLSYDAGQFCKVVGNEAHTMGVDFIDDIDLLIGGSPCQDLSIAKKDRKGLDGERSGLFREYLRILKQVKPKYFVLENVASMSKKDKDIITQEMGVEPIMIDANLVSAQNRKRLFRTNIPNVTLPEDKRTYLKDIIEEEVDEKYYISSEVFEKLKKFESNARLYPLDGKCCTLNTMQGGHRQPKILQLGRGYNKGGTFTDKVPTLTKSSRQENNKLLQNDRIRKLTPTECERLQCISDGYTSNVSNSQRYKSIGNAFNVDVIKHILSFIPR